MMTYSDNFLISKVDSDTLAKIENDVKKEILEVEKITDNFLSNKLIISKIYITIALLNFESEGIKEKLEIYQKEFDYYYKKAKNLKKIKTIKIYRG